MKFSEKLMNLRKSKGMSQEDLANKLNTTRQTVSKWESDQTTPDMNKLVEIAKLFEISLDELVNDVETSKPEDTYKENAVEKNNKKIAIKIFILGLIISIVLCGIGFIKQNNAKGINEERAKQATEQSQNAIEAAKKRIAEIEQEIISLEEEYQAKQREKEAAFDINDANWFSNMSKLQSETGNIDAKIMQLQNEKYRLENADYTVYYQLVEPISYLIFYYIGAGVFALMSLIALIYFLKTRRK